MARESYAQCSTAVRRGLPVDASIIVEVLIGASDRFGGKIAAMICRPSHRPAKPACPDG